MEEHDPSHDGLSSMDDPFLDMILTPPPIQPEDPGPLPGSILLLPDGYISDRTNDTTADGFTKHGKLIQVTFWAAHPPRASFFTVRIPELGRSAFGDMPKILCTEEDLVLLRVPICSLRCNLHPEDNDYFVYQAGTKDKRPSLQLIPTPPGLFFSDTDAGLLRYRRRRRNQYFIALLCRPTGGPDGRYDLHLFDSKSKSWSKKLVFVNSPEAKEYTYSSKVITIGGQHGSVGWVDLWRGILIYDLLRNSNHLRYIPLPSPHFPRLPSGPPLLVRDINVIGKEYIKFFDMQLYTGYTGRDLLTEGWEATTWKMKVSSTEWEEVCTMKVSNDSADLLEDELTQPILKGVYSGFPALSLHDDDVVYIMDKNDLLDRVAPVIAVDMRNTTVKCVADFASGRPLGYSFVYFQCGISKYLGLWSSTRCQRSGAETRKN